MAAKSMSNADFFEFLKQCRTEMQNKQEAFLDLLKPDSQWQYDLNAGTLAVDGQTFVITAIGTHNRELQTWLWAWANESFSDAARSASSRIRSLYDLTRFQVFDDPGLPADETNAEDLCAFAIHQLEAIGLFRSAGRSTTLYLAVDEPT